MAAALVQPTTTRVGTGGKAVRNMPPSLPTIIRRCQPSVLLIARPSWPVAADASVNVARGKELRGDVLNWTCHWNGVEMNMFTRLLFLLLLGSMGCGDIGDPSSRVRSWKGNAMRITTFDSTLLMASSAEFRTAEVSMELDEAAGQGSSLMIYRPVGTWTYSRTGKVGGCTFTTETIGGTLNKIPSQGFLLLYGDESPVPYEAGVGTGNFDATQSMVCPDPDFNETITLPLAEIVLPVAKDQNFTIPANSNTIQGTYTRDEGSDGFESSETVEWSLTACDPPQMECGTAAPDFTKCSALAFAAYIGCIGSGGTTKDCKALALLVFKSCRGYL